jgi:hypothetical protein
MPKGIRNLHVSVGECNLTHFGGIFLIHWFCKKLKLRWYLQNQIRFPHSYKLYHPVDLILAIIYALIAGVHRLSKTKILQGNGAFQQIVGLKSYPYSSSLRRFLKNINPRTIQSINKVHDYLRLKMFYLPQPRTSLLLDFDSTVLTLYGKFIEEAKVGYNPHKKGRRSYHPLLCFESHSKDFWHGVLRPGNVYTSAGGPEFLQACLAKVPPYIYRIRVRGDSGFYDHEFIEPLDDKCIGYAIVAKMTKPIKNKLGGLHYHKFKKDWEAAEFYYSPFRWKQPHRFVVLRRTLPEKDSEQLTLFTMKDYAYQVFVTNLSLNPENIWYFYRGRAAIENIIKELKESYALAKIPTNNFLANQAYFYLLLFAYNIVNWFKRICLPQKFQSATLQTIRTEFLVLPARLVKSQHKNVLKLPAEYISQKALEHIIHKIERMKSL